MLRRFQLPLITTTATFATAATTISSLSLKTHHNQSAITTKRYSSSCCSLFKPSPISRYIDYSEFGSALEHNSAINVFEEDHLHASSSSSSSTTTSFPNSTHVIATIGPASANENTIKRMIEEGVNICRLNFSHGTHEYHKANIELIRHVIAKHFKDKQCHVAIALDTKGPEIRLGNFQESSSSSSAVRFEVGQKVKVTNDRAFENKMSRDLLFIDYANLMCSSSSSSFSSSSSSPSKQHQQQRRSVTRILIADGVLELKVLSTTTTAFDENSNNSSNNNTPSSYLNCEVVSEAAIGSKSNVNLPGVVTDLPAISEKDMKDLEFAAKMNIDMIFASFTRSAFHIKMIGELLRSNKSKAAIIAKIENHEGVENINEILAENFCSGIMVARGDLGVEIPAERVFLAQKKIVSVCNLAAKPAVVATQMLESMVKNPRPTRAEIADVANAVLDGCDVTMLSGETAKGDHPVKAVETLKRVGQTAFNYVQHRKYLAQMISHNLTSSPISSTSAAAVLLSHQNKAKCIITVTRSGGSVHELRKYSPIAPIVAVCVDAERARKLSLVRGVIPLFFADIPYDQFDDLISSAIRFFTETPELSGWIGLKLKKGDLVVVSCTDSYIQENASTSASHHHHHHHHQDRKQQEGEEHQQHPDQGTTTSTTTIGGNQLKETGYETFVKILRV